MNAKRSWELMFDYPTMRYFRGHFELHVGIHIFIPILVVWAARYAIRDNKKAFWHWIFGIAVLGFEVKLGTKSKEFNPMLVVKGESKS